MAKGMLGSSPISSVLLPGGLNVDLNGLIVLVGPNSSGKTRLLQDIHATISGNPWSLVVAQEIRLRPPASLEDYIAHLEETGDLVEIQSKQYKRIGHQYGTDQGVGGDYSFKNFNNSYNDFQAQAAQPRSGVLREQSFLQTVGVLQCSALFIDRRLTLTNRVDSFDTHNVQPKSALQALRLNMTTEADLITEIKKVFGRGIWLDKSGGTIISLLVSDTDHPPPIQDQLVPKLMKQYRSIESEGEGIRSYVAVCIVLLLAQRPLCLIDEPEMCLHPPQARALGRFIGQYGNRPEGCTLVATHSSDVLRGILEGNPSVSVIRLTHLKGSFRARAVPPETLTQATRKPFSRSEGILDGLFSDGVVLCESDGDRIVYESTLRTLPPPLPDVRFIPVGGTGGFRSPIGLYRSLGVPVAIAADIDFLADDEIMRVVDEMGAGTTSISDLKSKISECVKAIRALKPELDATAVVAELEAFSSQVGTLEPGEAAKLRSGLNVLSKKLNPLTSLKSRGIEGLSSSLKDKVSSLIQELRAYGVFLVPCGELESWVPDLMKDGPSKRDKAQWATEAAKLIEENGAGDDDVWEYVRSIVRHLEPTNASESKTDTVTS